MAKAQQQWCLILLGVLVSAVLVLAQPASRDKEVLLEAGWADQLKWNTSADACSWQGINCTVAARVEKV